MKAELRLDCKCCIEDISLDITIKGKTITPVRDIREKHKNKGGTLAETVIVLLVIKLFRLIATPVSITRETSRWVLLSAEETVNLLCRQITVNITNPFTAPTHNLFRDIKTLCQLLKT